MGKKSILAIGDVHAPFTNLASLRRVTQIAKDLKPEIIVQVGDALDMYSWGRWPRTLNLMTPAKELELGKKIIYQMWDDLKKAAPKAKCFQMIGNHDERPIKKLIDKAPELEFLYKVEAIFDLPRGVELSKCERDELIIDDICFMHGFRSKLGDHAAHNRMNTVCGHSHRGGVVFERLGEKTIWELNCGYLAAEHTTPLSYGKQRTISKWTQGCGYITELGPQFIAF